MPHLPAHRFLDDRGIPYRKLSFSPETEKGAANVAQALGFRETKIVKTLIFETDVGEKALVMLAANQNAVSGHLKKALGSRNVRLAAPDVVKATTGYVIGSIPPFCWQPTGFRTFIEAALLDEPELGVGAGVWGEEIIITPTRLVEACGAIAVNLCDRGRPVFPEGGAPE